MILQHNINEENYTQAIEILKKFDSKQRIDLIYKYGHVLLQNEPAKSEELLIKNIKDIDLNKIIGSIFNVQVHQRIHPIRIIKAFIDNKFDLKSKAIHNSYILLLSEQTSKSNAVSKPEHQQEAQKLFKAYLDLCELKQKIPFNQEFAIKICKNNHSYDALIQIYNILKLYSEAVTIALEKEDIEQAQLIAQKVELDEKDQVLGRKLWMEIIVHLISKLKSLDQQQESLPKNSSQIGELEAKKDENVEKIVAITDQTSLIKIDDLIPLFDPNMKIKRSI